MTVTLKSVAELKLIAQSGERSREVDEKMMNLLKFIGGKTLPMYDLEISGTPGGTKKFTFINSSLAPTRNFYSVKIPEAWTTSYDLEEFAENLYCDACSFMVKRSTQYHFPESKVLVSGTPGTGDAVYRKELYQDRLDNQKPLVCPVCFKKNRFRALEVTP